MKKVASGSLELAARRAQAEVAPRSPTRIRHRVNHLCLACMTRTCEHVMPTATPHFSRREIQIVRLMSCGLSNKELATAVGLNEGTVKVYLHNINRKLGLTSRWELMLWAHNHAALLAEPAASPEASASADDGCTKEPISISA